MVPHSALRRRLFTTTPSFPPPSHLTYSRPLSLFPAGESSSSRSSVPEFFLGGNPFHCDCEMEWLQRINQASTRHRYPRVMDLDSDVTCTLKMGETAEEELVPISQVRPEQFLCEYQAHCFALCKCCDFFACDCRMQCPHGCSCFHDSTWSSNVIHCSSRGHLNIPHLLPMDATAVYLDGNNFTGTLESQAFIGRKRVRELYLNNSMIEAINNQTFNGLTELEVMHLESNLIRRLEGYEFGNLTSLLLLRLDNNVISFIDPGTFSPLVSLQELRLEGNRLTNFPVWQLSVHQELSRVYLSRNPWSCDCDFINPFREYQVISKTVGDFSIVQCRASTGTVSVSVGENRTCSDTLASAKTLSEDRQRAMDVIPILAAIITLVIIAVILATIVFVFRTPLRVWLHSKYGLRVLGRDTGKSDRPYDAFMSYSIKDTGFVHQVMVPQLEHQDPGYKLCLQHRDLPSNSSIVETFPGVSHLCAKHILVVSRSYLDSEWQRLKLCIRDHSKKLSVVIVMLEELTYLDLASVPEFNLLKKTSPVLQWNEVGFWNKLRYYLPDPRLAKHRSGGGDNNLSGDDWTYDAVITSNDSSAASTRSTIMGGSPRTLVTNDQQQHPHQQHQAVQLVSNPLDQWGSDHSDSAYSWHQDHQQHIYQTLDDSSSSSPVHHLGIVDVMLPNGRMVPATLVRNAANGSVVPLVNVDTVMSGGGGDSVSERQPLRQQQQVITFPRRSYDQHQQGKQQTQQQQLGKSSKRGHLV